MVFCHFPFINSLEQMQHLSFCILHFALILHVHFIQMHYKKALLRLLTVKLLSWTNSTLALVVQYCCRIVRLRVKGTLTMAVNVGPMQSSKMLKGNYRGRPC